MVSRGIVLKVTAVVLGVLLLGTTAAAGYVAFVGVEEPTVEQIDVRWGEITENTSVIQANIVVDNPNPIGIPGVISVGFEASLNGVTVADGRQSGLGLASGRNELELSIPIRNEKLPAWWVTHINRGERSTLTIQASVGGPFGVLAVDLPSQQQTLETAMLQSVGTDEATELSLFGEPVLVLGEQSAEWGEASAESTPLTITAEVTNRHDQAITLDGVGYVVTMNGITMGEGVDRSDFVVEPGRTKTLPIQAAIDTGAIDEWWVSHLQANETTDLRVRTYALVDGGQGDPTVELDLLRLELDLQTDLLGGGEARTTNVSTAVGGDLAFDTPTVALGGLEWGEVTDASTEIEAALTIENPNADSPINDLIDLTIQRTVSINDVRVADGGSHIEDLSAGRTNRTLSVALDNSKVPQWWARHVNNGESSTVIIDSGATVDVGVTAFDLELSRQERRFTTDALAGMNRDRDQTFTAGGEPVGTVRSTSASWGQADAQETPIDAAVRVRNDRDDVDLTVSDIGYTITMNNVTVAQGTDPVSVTIPPGATRTIDFTMVMDSQRMDEWWVSHIENGERTTLSVEISATVEAGGTSEQVSFDFLPGDATIETDILGSS